MRTSQTGLVSDVVSYNLKLWLAGLAAAVFVPLSVVAVVLDLLLRRGDGPEALSRTVLRASARFEAAIDIHGPLTDVRVAEDQTASVPA